MKQLNKILLATVSITLLNGCSLYATTDLSKIRNTYKSSQNQIKIDNISNERQQSVGFDKPTPYARGIACLSEPYLHNVKIINNREKNNSIQKNISYTQQISNLEDNIKKISKTGGYEKIVKSYKQKPEGGFYLREEGDIDPATLELKTEKLYPKSMQTLALDIRLLDEQISKNPKNIQNLITLRELIAYEFVELESELELQKEELKKIKAEQEKAVQHLGKIGEEKGNADDVYKVAVADIYDKTGKIFPAESTAISEMVAHALSYNAGMKLVDIPFGDKWNNSRYNPQSRNPNLSSQILSPNMGFAGMVFPSDMYISGALVQYDELPMTRPFGTRISLNIDPLDLSTDTRTINVGMILRAVNSPNALIMDNSHLNQSKQTGERASVYVQNTYFVKKIGSNVFEVKSKRLYGGNISIEVADPATYVVKEMVEAGMYKLLKKTIRPNEWTLNATEYICDRKVNPKLKSDEKI